MDTLARHPLTSLAAVALLVALGLWLSFPAPHAAPAPGRETGAPELDAANVGQRVTVVGRVVFVATGSPLSTPAVQSAGTTSTVVLAAGGREAVCFFPDDGERTTASLSSVVIGSPLVVRGCLERIDGHRAYLSKCAVIAESE